MKKFAVLIAILVLSVSAFAADALQIDSAHSSINFHVRHMLISNVPGSITGITGTINYDDRDVTKSSIEAIIKVSTINTNNEGRDQDLRGPSFFDTDKYPEARFVSKSIEKRGDNYVAIGDLTIKDVTKEIELPFELAKNNTPAGPAIGVSASTTINRKDYHINYNRVMDNGGAVVSDDVKLEINLEAKPPRKEAPKPSSDTTKK
ncbi:MAG TPA: YceI family protein [Terriglobales bacterium]|nr:YceI family protein [Terriglobales bacterium]